MRLNVDILVQHLEKKYRLHAYGSRRRELELRRPEFLWIYGGDGVLPEPLLSGDGGPPPAKSCGEGRKRGDRAGDLESE